ncbi:MAG: cyclic nucleotide-binding domain-containing protein [Pseudomonadota bacterium]|nr:cyclic nucleotide-binding domain-containing protein [Pseudomonadota bacterium]
MFLESNFTEPFEKTDTRCKTLLETALAGITPLGEALQFEMIEDLYANAAYERHAFVVEQGAVGHEQDGKTLFHYDEGDIIGLEVLEGFPRAKFYAESPVTLLPYDRDALWQAAMNDTHKARQWGDYLLAECVRHSAVIASMDAPVDKASLGFQSYMAGETIIEEGTESDTVYSIVEGHAEVYVQGVKVGEVLEDEIFGAMSLLTHSPRTATVVADSRCLVMVAPRHQFETMIKTHPRICMSLMENMARQIVSLNERVTAAHLG